jgi:hypothetical protein
MPNRPSEVRKETFGHEALFDCEPHISVPETDGFSYSPAMDPWYHGVKIEDYAHVGNTDWFSVGAMDNQPYDIDVPIEKMGKNVFGLKMSPSAGYTPIAVTEVEALLLGRSPHIFNSQTHDEFNQLVAQMEFPPFEKVPSPPEIWRVADTYKQSVLQNHHKAITMLLHSMYLFKSTPVKAKDEHKVELARTIRTEIWHPMVSAASKARGWTEEQEKMVHDALDCKIFFVGKSSERKKFWVALLEQSKGYVINKQRLFDQVSKR